MILFHILNETLIFIYILLILTFYITVIEREREKMY